jgi:hypothetical protein
MHKDCSTFFSLALDMQWDGSAFNGSSKELYFPNNLNPALALGIRFVALRMFSSRMFSLAM